MPTSPTWDRLLAIGMSVDGEPVLTDDDRPAIARDIDMSVAFTVTYDAGSRTFRVDLDPVGAGTAGSYEPTASTLVARNAAAQLKVTTAAPTEIGQLTVATPDGRFIGYEPTAAAGRRIPYRTELSHNQQFYKFVADTGATTESREVFGYLQDHAELIIVELWFYGTVTPDDTDYGLILIESTDMLGDDVVLAAVYTTETAGDVADYDKLGAPVTAYQPFTFSFQPPASAPYIVAGGRHLQLRVLKGSGTLTEGGAGVVLPRIGGHFTYRLLDASVEHPT